MSTPFIVHWPAGIQARGELRHQVGHLIDLMPTCLEVASATYPLEHQGQKLHALEGKSLVAAFGNQPIQRGPLFWEHEGHRAVRDGKWKLVANKDQPWELYDLEADRVELNDLAKAHPDRVEAVAKQWHAWAVRAQVFPSPFLGEADGTPPPKKKAKGGD